ncbi:MAG: peptide deformylase [Bacteroidia bacterium]
MILPIVGYGHPSLRRTNEDITPDYPGLHTLIENMYETMYNALGVGLAAPQVNVAIRLFIVDGSALDEEEHQEKLSDFKKVFINPYILQETGVPWAFEEGCLSIPDLREDVRRAPDIVVRYLDEQFQEHTDAFSGMKARIIQHEYDHIEGVLFVDRISPLRKRVIKSRLQKISRGQVEASYPMKFPNT